MRRFIKPALVTLGAAAAVFAVVSQAAPFQASPAAKAKTFCSDRDDAATLPVLIPVPFDVQLPTLPTIPSVETPEIPCIEAPTLNDIPVPSIPAVSIPPVSIPTLHELLRNVPTEIEIPIPNFFPTTTTQPDSCETSAAAVVSAFCP